MGEQLLAGEGACSLTRPPYHLNSTGATLMVAKEHNDLSDVCA